MPNNMKPSGFAAVCIIAFLCALTAQAEDKVDYQKLMAEKSPALVTVKFNLKMSMGGDDGEESPSEATGVMIDPKGTVLCSNTYLGGMMNVVGRMMGSSMRSMMGEMSAVPSEIKVLIGEDTEGIDARLLARDTDLDLAWIQIKEPGEKKFDYIDLTKGSQPKVGDHLIVLHRLGKHFDRAPTFSEARMTAEVKKPRDLYVPTAISSSFGMPVFSTGRELIGIVSLQFPESDDSEGNPMGMFASMFNMQDTLSPMILPAEDAAKATKRAIEEGGKSEAKTEDVEKDKKEEKE